jgi:hypothetical protein
MIEKENYIMKMENIMMDNFPMVLSKVKENIIIKKEKFAMKEIFSTINTMEMVNILKKMEIIMLDNFIMVLNMVKEVFILKKGRLYMKVM